MIAGRDLLEPRSRRLARWIGAAVLIGAVHIGGGGFAMLYWPDELQEEAPGAIVVEIAPIATTVTLAMHDLPPGQLADETPATKATSDPKIEKVDEEVPKVDLSSSAPDPEVTLRKPTEVDKPPEERTREEPSPQVKTAAEETAAAKAAAPTRIAGELATKSAAADAGAAADVARSIASWHNAVVRQINYHRRDYVAEPGVQGIVDIRIKVDSSGKLVLLEVAHPSGYALLDQDALALLKRAAPLPLPPTAAGELVELIIPVTFRQKK